MIEDPEGPHPHHGGTGIKYVPVGEIRPIVGWPFPKSAVAQSVWQQLDKDRRSLTLSACFCSVFDECWTSHLGADLPVPVKACDARGRVNFAG